MNIPRTTILAERLRRQRLTDPLKPPEAYIELFRLLQPVPTLAGGRTGESASSSPSNVLR